jgi:CheY-like chemotaxis protein
MPRDIERGKAAGFTDYLTKPLDIGLFLQVADALLDAATTLPPMYTKQQPEQQP